MRPLFHPSIEDVTVEAVLHALSDPVRVAIYADIVDSNCSHNCSNFLTISEKTIPKSPLSKDFQESFGPSSMLTTYSRAGSLGSVMQSIESLPNETSKESEGFGPRLF